MNWQFRDLVKAVYRLAPEGSALDAITSREMFQTAQWALGSEAAQSLAQMAARGATGNPALAALARERQDLVVEWQKRDGLRNTWLGQAPQNRNAQAEGENSPASTPSTQGSLRSTKGSPLSFPITRHSPVQRRYRLKTSRLSLAQMKRSSCFLIRRNGSQRPRRPSSGL